MLFATARCYNADVEAAVGGVPVVGGILFPARPVPAYIQAIGTPAAANLGEADMAAWFDPAAEDPYDVARWREVKGFAAHMGTPGGLAEACKRASAAAGADRGTNPELGALACSDNGTVTQLQRFAAQLLAMRAEVALWYRGAPGASIGAVEGLQAQIRLACGYDMVARQGTDSVFGGACATVLGLGEIDGQQAFTALGEAYRSVAAELARLDPTVEQEPGYFEAPQ
jgi:hypothetical protein